MIVQYALQECYIQNSDYRSGVVIKLWNKVYLKKKKKNEGN